MPIARSTKEVFDYVVKEDRDLPLDKQTVFHLRRLSTRALTRVRDLEGEGQTAELALRAGIAGWERFADGDGQAVEPRHEKGEVLLFGIPIKEPLSIESLNRLPTSIIGELATAIITGNTLSKEDQGN